MPSHGIHQSGVAPVLSPVIDPSVVALVDQPQEQLGVLPGTTSVLVFGPLQAKSMAPLAPGGHGLHPKVRPCALPPVVSKLHPAQAPPVALVGGKGYSLIRSLQEPPSHPGEAFHALVGDL